MNGGITARSLPIDGNGGRQGNPISRRRERKSPFSQETPPKMVSSLFA